jgi:hypothetical protein
MKNVNPIQSLKAILTSTILLISMISYAQTKEIFSIAAKDTVIIEHEKFELYAANLKNRSVANLEIVVVDKNSGAFIRGFGLAPYGKATVMVESSSVLQIINLEDKEAKIKVVCSNQNPKMTEKPTTSIEFNLLNSTNESIPLVIPTVMNPNLSPNSTSRVSLEIGQEILYRYQGKRRVLLTVSNEIKAGQQIDVAQLIEELKVKQQ